MLVENAVSHDGIYGTFAEIQRFEGGHDIFGIEILGSTRGKNRIHGKLTVGGAKFDLSDEIGNVNLFFARL